MSKISAETIMSYHHPDAWKQSMVYSVWEDGEVTLEKGGELFGERNLHIMQYGDAAKALDPALFPVVGNNGHGRVYCNCHKEAMELHNLILAR